MELGQKVGGKKLKLNNPTNPDFRFHSLNALRFFAFFLVFLKHINGAIVEDTLPFLKFITNGGAVEFFFVLGGFLFTYLLVKQKEQGKEFSFIRFYAKRILRTWPLFFLVIGLAYACLYGTIALKGDEEGYRILENIGLIDGNGYWPSWKHSILFLENYKMWQHHLFLTPEKSWFPILSPLIVTWSLCIQEHFYLIWPVFIILVPNKWIPRLMILGIFVSFSVKFGLAFYLKDLNYHIAHDIITYLDLYCLGGLLGFYAYHKFDAISAFVLKIPDTLKFTFVLFLLLLLKADEWFDQSFMFTKAIWNIIIGTSLTALIALFIPRESTFKFSPKSIFSRFGMISYSLYLTHLVVILIFLSLFKKYEFQINSGFNLFILFFSSLTVSIMISYITYYTVESPFLKLKAKLREIQFLKKIR